MSARALLKGVETRLRSAACLNDAAGNVSGIQPDGRPPSNAGQWYYAIHFGGATGDDPNALSNDRLYNLSVTITRRVANIPKDRRGARITTDQEMLDAADLVGDWLHQDDVSRISANELIDGTAEWAALNPPAVATVNGFVEPLKLASIGPVQQVDASWVGASEGNDVFTAVIQFVGARRVRPLGSDT